MAQVYFSKYTVFEPINLECFREIDFEIINTKNIVERVELRNIKPRDIFHERGNREFAGRKAYQLHVQNAAVSQQRDAAPDFAFSYC